MSGWLNRRVLLRLLACALALFLLVNYARTGDVTVRDVAWRNDATGQELKVMLPHSFTPFGPDDAYTYRFEMPASLLDRLSPFVIDFVGCATSISIGGTAQPVMGECLRRASPAAGDLNLWDADAVEVRFTPPPDMRVTGMRVSRPALLSLYPSVLVLFLSFYLFALSFAGGRDDPRRFNAACATLGVFFLSFAGGVDYNNSIFFWRTPWLVDWYHVTYWEWMFIRLQWLLMGAMLLACFCLWQRVRVTARLDRCMRRLWGMDEWRVACACAGLFLIVTSLLSQVMFRHLPHVADSHAQYMQSLMFLSGSFSLPVHPLKEFFDYTHIYNDDRFFSHYYPGHILILTLGQLVGAPWVINPLMGALALVATFLLAREIAGRRAAILAAMLVLLSPFIVFMSSEYMNHATALFFMTVFLLAYIRMHKTGSRFYALLTGFCAGFAVITRLQAILPFGLPVAVHALWWFARNPRRTWFNCLCMGVGLLPPLLFFMFYNYTVTSSVLPPQSEAPFLISKTFSVFSWEHPGVELRRALNTVYAMHIFLFGWPGSSLVFVFLLFLLRGSSPYTGLLIACCLMQGFFLYFIPFSDDIFGPRYYYESSTAFIVLTAIGMLRLPALLRRRLGVRVALSRARGMVWLSACVMTLYAVPAHILPHYQLYKTWYWEGNPDYYDFVMENTEKPALVFITQPRDWMAFGFTLPPRDDDPVIVAHDLGEHNHELIGYYPARHAYLFDGWRVIPLH